MLRKQNAAGGKVKVTFSMPALEGVTALYLTGSFNDWSDPGPETHRLPDEIGDGAPATVYRIGRRGNGVYALFEVRDAAVVRSDEARSGDRLEIGTVSGDDEFLRFEVDAGADGPASAWLVREDGRRAPDNRIEAAWSPMVWR